MKVHQALTDFELTPEYIEQLKEQHGKIYKVKAADIDFVIRPLYKDDQQVLNDLVKTNANLTQADFDDKVVDLALVGPRADHSKGGWAALPAGIVPTLSTFIQAKSGYIVQDAPDSLGIKVENLGKTVVFTRPTQEEIDELKAVCPFQLRLVTIEGEYFIIRPVTRQEFRMAMNKSQESGDALSRDEEISKKVVMWPKKLDWSGKPVGYPETLTNFALGISGYSLDAEVEEL